MKKPMLYECVKAARCAGLALLAMLASVGVAAGATPESPEVQAAVARAVRYLESDNIDDHRLGAKALLGMALFKGGANADHPKILTAVGAIQQAIKKLKPVDKDDAGRPIVPEGVGAETRQPIDIYSAGLSIIFLCTIDPSRYGAEIQALLDYLQVVQKNQGAWGYAGGNHATSCDTSMTQYAVLAAWEATQVGFRVPIESTERVMIWLIKTQDPSGQYGYQGKVSDSFRPVGQSGMRPSMTAAGMGSLYIAADLLGLIERARRDDDLPPALKEVKVEGEDKKPRTAIDPRVAYDAMSRGNRWMGANFVVDPPQWPLYYLYAVERYQSFREEAEGKIQKEPAWYNAGVRHLLETQQENGSWKTKTAGVVVPDTSFAVLFLLRSTKKSIERARNYGAGMLVGGRGLPTDTSQVEVREGKVIARPLLGTAEKLLAALDDPDDPEYAKAIEALSGLAPKQAETLAAKHRRKLQEMAAGQSPEARLAAVRTLGNSGNLDNVSTLIFALTDPDPAVVRQARDGLRRISRKFNGFGLPDEPTRIRRDEAIKQWKAWFRTIRPDAEFEE